MLRRSLARTAALLALTTAVAGAQTTTSSIALSVSVVPTLRVYSFGSLNYGSVPSATVDQTLSIEPAFNTTGFQIVGEMNRVVAISCPETVILSDPLQGPVGPIFTPRFSLFTAAGQQSSYVRGPGGCPSVTLQPVVNEGQVVLALGGDLQIPQNYAGNFAGTYTISVAYP